MSRIQPILQVIIENVRFLIYCLQPKFVKVDWSTISIFSVDIFNTDNKNIFWLFYDIFLEKSILFLVLCNYSKTFSMYMLKIIY